MDLKRASLLLWSSMVVSGLARAGSLSPADRDRGLQYLESTKRNIIEVTKGLSAAEWNFKPAPDRWAIAEVMEHIAASEDLFLGTVVEKVMKAPPRPPGEDVKEIDELVLGKIPDRTKKAKAPEPLVPNNRYGSPEAALKHFLESREKTIAFLKTTDGLRDHAIDSPLKKKLDAYEWILFCAAHSERHTKQMNEVKADSKFPKV
jgi:hypothetical protein